MHPAGRTSHDEGRDLQARTAPEGPNERWPARVPIDLLRRYDKPGPRYTSYPTAVEFHEAFDEAAYRDRLAEAAAHTAEPLSLYLHLPFCRERCTFCGCMVVITQKAQVAEKYLTYLHRELAMLAESLGGRRRVVQYHWGGGTPTYLTVPQMAALHAEVTRHFRLEPGAEIAIEVDPRVTTFEQLALLRDLGFNRLSMGVQDKTPEVQEAIGRIQPEEVTRSLFDEARRLGFESINIDLIYGLPLQSRESFGQSVDSVIALRPDRVAAYSYAHVPWVRAHQKGIDVAALPTGDRKLELFAEAMDRFLAAGYHQIGMDHFALPGDELARAAAAGTLHRNFMGYTTRPAADMVGAGVSAIGDVAGAFAQNVKKLSTYYAALDAGRFPIERGYRLDADDAIRRQVILGLMCNSEIEFDAFAARTGRRFTEYFSQELTELAAGPMRDGLVWADDRRIALTATGRLLVRNVCMVFDRHLRARTASVIPVFSRTV
jgi:oxygen-independent coproporphyrinogen-3 oxidase